MADRSADEDVIAVNRSTRTALTSEDRFMQIEQFFDMFGDQCGPDEAVVAVAMDDDGDWWCIDLTQFEQNTIH